MGRRGTHGRAALGRDDRRGDRGVPWGRGDRRDLVLDGGRGVAVLDTDLVRLRGGFDAVLLRAVDALRGREGGRPRGTGDIRRPRGDRGGVAQRRGHRGARAGRRVAVRVGDGTGDVVGGHPSGRRLRSAARGRDLPDVPSGPEEAHRSKRDRGASRVSRARLSSRTVASRTVRAARGRRTRAASRSPACSRC